MEPERESEKPGDAWLDVPDPLGKVVAPKSRLSNVPADPSPTRAAVRARRLMALGGAVLWAALVLSFFGLREGIAEDANIVVTGAALSSVLLVLVVRSSIGGGKRGLGPRLSWARALAIGGPAAFIVWALATGREQGLAPLGPISEAVACVSVAFLLIVPAMVLAMMAVRRSFASSASWRGALMGAACGFVAAIVLTLHCASSFGGHVALAHGLPIAIAGAVGALLATKFARA